MSAPRARRSAALPASPPPPRASRRADLVPRRGRRARGDRPPCRLPPAAPADAHGGGAAQSRGGLRRGRSSIGGSGRGWLHRSSASSLLVERRGRRPRPRPPRRRPARRCPPAASATGMACAASRRAQSWNVGHTGNARREAVGLLVGEGARCRLGLGETAVAVVRSIGTLVAIVFERDERAGR